MPTDVSLDPALRIGVDLGGTKIEAIALDANGQPCWRRRVPTPQGDYPGTVTAIVELVSAIERELGRRGTVGVGIPGAISSLTGRVKNANSVCLIGQPLGDDLSRALQREVRLANDANCFAVSEATDGAAAGAESVMGVILGTGVGSGLVIGGRIVVGANAIGGEFGHIPLPSLAQTGMPNEEDPDFDVRRRMSVAETPGPRCYCGRYGCVETWLSGPGLAADHRRMRDWSRTDDPTFLGSDEIGARRLAQPPPPSPDAPAIIAAMRAGDPAARATFDRYVDRLARSLAAVINIFDPHVIVLGGGLSSIDELYVEVPACLPRYVFSDDVRTRVVRNQHGDSSGVRGAAWLWPPTPAA